MQITGNLDKDLIKASFADDIRKIAKTYELQEDIKNLVLAINNLNRKVSNLKTTSEGK